MPDPAVGPLSNCPWENPDGSTNVDGWLTAYAEDDNTFWRTESGHIMNVVDELIGRLDDAR
jgi:hypothetical protein